MVNETDVARFFRLFHGQYPTSLSKKRREEIRKIAAQVLSREMSWEEGLDKAGIPIEESDGDTENVDSAYQFFVWMIMLLFLTASLGAFPNSKQQQGPSIAPEDQQRILDAFRDTFEQPANDEPHEWIEVGKPAVPLEPRDPSKKPTQRRQRIRKQSRTGTGAGPKRPPRERAKKKPKPKT